MPLFSQATTHLDSIVSLDQPSKPKMRITLQSVLVAVSTVALNQALRIICDCSSFGHGKSADKLDEPIQRAIFSEQCRAAWRVVCHSEFACSLRPADKRYVSPRGLSNALRYPAYSRDAAMYLLYLIQLEFVSRSIKELLWAPISWRKNLRNSSKQLSDLTLLLCATPIFKSGILSASIRASIRSPSNDQGR